jgi:hypothetical protein
MSNHASEQKRILEHWLGRAKAELSTAISEVRAESLSAPAKAELEARVNLVCGRWIATLERTIAEVDVEPR